MKTCIMCQAERPLTDFSTLTRQQVFDTVGAACTPCYLRQLVLEYPEWQVDGTVIYRPYEQPRMNYINQIKRWLPGWMHDPKVIKRYSPLGDLKLQAAPFLEFSAALVGGNNGL